MSWRRDYARWLVTFACGLGEGMLIDRSAEHHWRPLPGGLWMLAVSLLALATFTIGTGRRR